MIIKMNFPLSLCFGMCCAIHHFFSATGASRRNKYSQQSDSWCFHKLWFSAESGARRHFVFMNASQSDKNKVSREEELYVSFCGRLLTHLSLWHNLNWLKFCHRLPLKEIFNQINKHSGALKLLRVKLLLWDKQPKWNWLMFIAS